MNEVVPGQGMQGPPVGAETQEITDLREGLLGLSDDIERKILVASESGLFVFGKRMKRELNVAEGSTQDTLVGWLEDARTVARFGRAEELYVVADRYLLKAQMLLHEAIMERGICWKYIHLHRIGIFLFQISVMSIIAIVALPIRLEVPGWFPILFKVVLPATWDPIFVAAAFGAIGAVLRSLYWLFSKIEASEFYDRFVITHLSAPGIGAILGILAYLAISGGITAITGPASDSEGNAEILYAFAVTAGFSWENALQMLAGLAKRLSPKEEGSEQNDVAEENGEEETT